MTFAALLYLTCTGICMFIPGVRAWKAGIKPEINWDNPGPWLNLVSFACAMYLAIGTLL